MSNQTVEQFIKDYERRCNDGYGQGEGAAYKPWFEAHHVSSRGKTTRLMSYLLSRQVLAESLLEESTFRSLQRLPGVVDIREQYPLHPAATIEIASRLGLQHPAYKGELKVMTTDFLVTFGTGQQTAVNVKPSTNLDRRTIEKMDIERTYWTERGVNWTLFTDQSMTTGYRQNLAWIDERYHLQEEQRCSIPIRVFEEALGDALSADRKAPLYRVFFQVDQRLGVQAGTTINVFRHLLARRRWILPLNARITVERPLPCLPTLNPLVELA